MTREIAKFYKEQHKRQEEQRAKGYHGWLEFDICPLVPDFDIVESAMARWPLDNVS